MQPILNQSKGTIRTRGQQRPYTARPASQKKDQTQQRQQRQDQQQTHNHEQNSNQQDSAYDQHQNDILIDKNKEGNEMSINPTKQKVTFDQYSQLLQIMISAGQSPAEATSAMAQNYEIVTPLLPNPSDSILNQDELNALLHEDSDGVPIDTPKGDEETGDEDYGDGEEDEASSEETSDEEEDQGGSDEESSEEEEEEDSEEDSEEEGESSDEEDTGDSEDEEGEEEGQSEPSGDSEGEEDLFEIFLDQTHESPSGENDSLDKLPQSNVGYKTLTRNLVDYITQVSLIEKPTEKNLESLGEECAEFRIYNSWLQYAFKKGSFKFGTKKPNRKTAEWQDGSRLDRAETLAGLLTPIAKNRSNASDYPTDEEGQRKDIQFRPVGSEEEAHRLFKNLCTKYSDQPVKKIILIAKSSAPLLVENVTWDDPVFKEIYNGAHRNTGVPPKGTGEKEKGGKASSKAQSDTIIIVLFLLLVFGLVSIFVCLSKKLAPETPNANINVTGTEVTAEDVENATTSAEDATGTSLDAESTADAAEDEASNGTENAKDAENVAEPESGAEVGELIESSNLETVEVSWYAPEPNTALDLNRERYGDMVIEGEGKYSCYTHLTKEEAQNILAYIKASGKDYATLRYFAAPNGFLAPHNVNTTQLESIISGEFDYFKFAIDFETMSINNYVGEFDDCYRVNKILTTDEIAEYLKKFDEDSTLTSVNIGNGVPIELPNGTVTSTFSCEKDRLQNAYNKATKAGASKVLFYFEKDNKPGFGEE